MLSLLKRTFIVLNKQRKLNHIKRLVEKRTVAWQKSTSRIKRLMCEYDAAFGTNTSQCCSEWEKHIHDDR